MMLVAIHHRPAPIPRVEASGLLWLIGSIVLRPMAVPTNASTSWMTMAMTMPAITAPHETRRKEAGKTPVVLFDAKPFRSSAEGTALMRVPFFESVRRELTEWTDQPVHPRCKALQQQVVAERANLLIDAAGRTAYRRERL